MKQEDKSIESLYEEMAQTIEELRAEIEELKGLQNA